MPPAGSWRRCHYAEVDGLAVVEGDMIIGTVEEVEAHTREVEARGGPEAERVHAQGVGATPWTCGGPRRGSIHHRSSPADSSPSDRRHAAWQRGTRIRFVLRTASNAAQYPDYVTFPPGTQAVHLQQLPGAHWRSAVGEAVPECDDGQHHPRDRPCAGPLARAEPRGPRLLHSHLVGEHRGLIQVAHSRRRSLTATTCSPTTTAPSCITVHITSRRMASPRSRRWGARPSETAQR